MLHNRNVAMSSLGESENVDDREIDYSQLLRHRPRLINPQHNSLPPRTTAWVLCMLLIGTILITLGLGQFYDAWFGDEEKEDHIGLSMICMGSFMFIPGIYATYTLYGAWNRWDGFSYTQIPNYGD